MPTAVITGSTGQTGSYLTEILIGEGWDVQGISAHHIPAQESINHIVDISHSAKFREVLHSLNPDVIFNLAAISNVAQSWEDPVKTTEVNCISVATCLEYVQSKRNQNKEVRFVQASSALVLNSTQGKPLDEYTNLSANNPYASSKLFGHVLTQSYRAAGCFASNAILFNHESPRRPSTFVTRKITQSVAHISLGLQDKLVLGSLDSIRDWGWAPDYAEALKLIGTANKADDFVISTGESHSIRDFLTIAFSYVGIEDWARFVESDSSFQRPTDEPLLIGNPSKIENELGWKRSKSFSQLVESMVESDLQILKS